VKSVFDNTIKQVLGDVPKARAALSFYRRSNAIDDEMSKLDQDVKAAKSLADKQFTLREMFGKKYRRPLFIAVFLQVVNYNYVVFTL